MGIRFSFFVISILFLLCMVESPAQVRGCTDRAALNFSAAATVNDGSCIYTEASVFPSASFILPEVLNESSGLLFWDGKLWSHNDNLDNNIYSIDTFDFAFLSSFELTGTVNNDWEDITIDDEYIFVGDFGNNLNGSRKDLKILRISKNSILHNEADIDTIAFSWSDQDESDPSGLCNTDFDCEAFIAFGDSLYLFTKQWISNKTGIYTLPKEPGTHTARLKSIYESEGMITGATCLESLKLVVLCGYDSTVRPFLILLYDFRGDDFLNACTRKIMIDLPFHQTEGICTYDGLTYYISNEKTSMPLGLFIPQKIHIFDLEPFLGRYVKGNGQGVDYQYQDDVIQVFPNPVSGIVTIMTSKPEPLSFDLISMTGIVVFSGKIEGGSGTIDISGIPPGMYQLHTEEESVPAIRIIKI